MAKYLSIVSLLYFVSLCLSRSPLEDESHQKASDLRLNRTGNLSGTSNNISTTSTPGICHGTSTIRSPCTVTSDSIYGGLYVDCSSRSLTSLDPRWFPPNTTTLILDRNRLTRIEGDTFSCLTHLRKLSLTSCALSMLPIDVFKGVSNLEYLDLEDNSLPLSQNEFLQAVLRHTPGLRHLMIGQNSYNIDDCPSPQNSNLSNGNSSNAIYRRDKTIYSNVSKEIDSIPCINIFFLTQLETLSMEVSGEVYIGEEFSQLQNLNTLVLHIQDTTAIRNQSFFGLRNVHLRELHLRSHFFFEIYYFDTGVFQYLHSLTILKLYGINVGNYKIAKSLWPFFHRNMTLIYLVETSASTLYTLPTGVMRDYVLTKDTLQYLVDICLSHLAWRNSGILTIDFSSFLWKMSLKCLKSLDLSGNEIGKIGWRTSLFVLPKLINLEIVEIVNKPTLYTPAYSDTSQLYSEVNLLKDRNTGEYGNEITDISSTLKSSIKNTLTVYLPPSIQILKLNALSTTSVFSIDKSNLQLMNGENMWSLYATGMPKLIQGNGRILGLQNLRILDFSYSGVHVNDYFYDDFPNLEILALRSILPDYYFDKVIPCQRLVQHLKRLKYLDISKNSIPSLPSATFSLNPYLTYLNLSENRFSSITFDLNWTPRLTVLDLTHNIISTFSEDEMNAIDAHAQTVGTFYLKLSGNNISCVCSQIQLLDWLQRTPALLDNNGNYSCIGEDGRVTSTADLSDVLAFWRQCQGRMWFMISLVLASMMTALLLAVVTVNRFSRYVVAFLWRVFHDNCRPRASRDYRYDVFIGYAVNDYQFVKYQLNVFLEKDLKKRTYIHQRDLGPGPLHQQLCDAIADSWRVVMVITRTFLNDQDMAANIVQYAISSESWLNQGRLFVLVDESIRHAIPANLLNLLDDSRIIVIQDLNSNRPRLDYQQIQSIKTCLLPFARTIVESSGTMKSHDICHLRECKEYVEAIVRCFLTSLGDFIATTAVAPSTVTQSNISATTDRIIQSLASRSHHPSQL